MKKMTITRQMLTLNPFLTCLGFEKFYRRKTPFGIKDITIGDRLGGLYSEPIEVEVEYFFYTWKGYKLPFKLNP